MNSDDFHRLKARHQVYHEALIEIAKAGDMKRPPWWRPLRRARWEAVLGMSLYAASVLNRADVIAEERVRESRQKGRDNE